MAMTPKNAPGDVRCPNCDGTGKIVWREGSPGGEIEVKETSCWRCHGTGVIGVQGGRGYETK